MTNTAEILYHTKDEKTGLNKITFDIGDNNLLTIQEGRTPAENSGYLTNVHGEYEPKKQQDLDAAGIAELRSGIRTVKLANGATHIDGKDAIMTGMRLLFSKENTK